jgi:hypothetical protein
MSEQTTSDETTETKLPAGEISPFDLVDTHPEDDVVPDPRQAEMQKQLDKGLKDSFPASDPVSALQPITAGPTEEGSEAMATEAGEVGALDGDASLQRGND